MKEEILSEVLKLNISERIHFIEDVWDSIASVPQAVELTEPQIKELDRRLEEYHKHPDLGSPWADVKSRILSEK